jgi:hypothetical protein
MASNKPPYHPPHRTETGFSICSSTASVPYDTTEAVFYTEDNRISYEKKENLMKGDRLAEGIQTVDVPKLANSVNVYLGGSSVGEGRVFYAKVPLPKKVRRNRLRGHYKQLFIKSA